MIGAAISAVGQIGAGVANYFLTPGAPSYDSDSAYDFIDNYVSSAQSAVGNVGMIGNPADSQFKYSLNDAFRASDQALKYNQTKQPQFNALANDIYQADVDSKIDALNKVNPALMGQVETAGRVNEALISGEVPMDVQNEIMRSTAYQAMYGGYGSTSGMGRNLSLRDMGVNSLYATQIGQSQAQAWGSLMGGLLPTQTSGYNIMQNNGVSSNQAMTQAYNIAAQQLQSDQFNITTDLSAAQSNQRAQLGQAQLTAGIYTDALQGQLGTLTNDYNSQMNSRNVEAQRVTGLTGSIASAAGTMGGSVTNQNNQNYMTSMMTGAPQQSPWAFS